MDSKDTAPERPSYDDSNLPAGTSNDAGTYESFTLDGELPVYSHDQIQFSAKPLKEFDVTAEQKGKVYATLSILGDEGYSKQFPVIVEGSALKGRVRLNLNDPDSISSVSLCIKGYFGIGGTTYTAEDLYFLDLTRTLWSQSEGEPHQSFTQSLAGGPASASKFKDSLQGEYTWPFSVEIPREVVIHTKHSGPQTFRIPQTFNEQFIRATIRYTASVKITRQGLFKSNDEIRLNFGYITISHPPSFPPLTQVAYEEGSPLLGPTIDHDGWHSQDPINLQGTMFKTQTVQVECTLFLARPLSYTRGSFIPLCLRLRSENEQALDLLLSPKAVRVRLRRRIQDHSHRDNAFESPSFRDTLDYSQLATWWASKDQDENSGQVRLLHGELHLKAGMSPNAELADFKITYSVMLYDFEAPGLKFPSTKFIQENPVEICNFYGPGPRPKPTTVPNTDPDVNHKRQIAPIVDEFSKGFY